MSGYHQSFVLLCFNIVGLSEGPQGKLYSTATQQWPLSGRRSCNLPLVGLEISPSDGPGFEDLMYLAPTAHP